jgi:CheY-like chemotaxis protein
VTELDPGLPPGLLEAYLQSARAQVEALAELARRLRDRRDDPAVLGELRSEAHKVRGSAGSYGFEQATAVAAEIEEAAKLWLAGGGGDDRAATAAWLVDRLRVAFGPNLGTAQVPEIFVIEDDAALVELFEYGLNSRGYRYSIFRNGREALAALLALDTGASHPVVLLDVDLPALDGRAVFEALQRERPGAYRVVFMTVHGGEDEQLRALEGGATDYLVKPLSLRVVLEKIRRWVGR